MKTTVTALVYGEKREAFLLTRRFLAANWPGLIAIGGTIAVLIEAYYLFLVPTYLQLRAPTGQPSLVAFYTSINIFLGFLAGIPPFIITLYGILCTILMASSYSRENCNAPLGWVLSTAMREFWRFLLTNAAVQVRTILLFLLSLPLYGLLTAGTSLRPANLPLYISFTKVVTGIAQDVLVFVGTVWFGWAPYLCILHSLRPGRSVQYSKAIYRQNRSVLRKTSIIAFALPLLLNTMLSTYGSFVPTPLQVGRLTENIVYVWNYLVVTFYAIVFSKSSLVESAAEI